MSSLYKKSYIYSYNKQDMLDILEGKIAFTIDPTDLRYRRKYVTLQHFLIQYIEKHGKNRITKELLKKFYNDFLKYPYLFVDSPLINTSFINRSVPLKDRKEILNKRKEYFDSEKNIELSNNLLKNNKLSNSQKNQLYSYLIMLLRKNDPKDEELLKKHAEMILSSNQLPKEMNETELKFYCMYISKRSGKDTVHTDLHIIDTNPKLGGSQLYGIIFINIKAESNANELWKITKVVCHETRHTYQEKQVHNKTTRRAFEMARHLLFLKYLKTNDYDVYNVNYKYLDIEVDAESHAIYDCINILETLNRPDLALEASRFNTVTHNQRNFYKIMYNEQGTAISEDAFTVEYLDKIIKSHPEELERYVVLQKIYNKDGSRKPLGELLASKINEGLDDKEIYDNYIFYEIVMNKLSQIDLSKTKAGFDENLFKSLGGIYRQKVELLKDYCSDTEYTKTNEKQIQLTTLYEIQIINNILNFIDDNIDYLLSCRENGMLNQTSFIYNFIYDLSGFDIDKINNEVIKNDEAIRKRINSLLLKHNIVVKKINEQYIKDRINNLSIEQLHTIINTPEGSKKPLIDYLYYDILPRITSHLDVNMNDQRVQLDVIIKYCIAQVTPNKEKENII